MPALRIIAATATGTPSRTSALLASDAQFELLAVVKIGASLVQAVQKLHPTLVVCEQEGSCLALLATIKELMTCCPLPVVVATQVSELQPTPFLQAGAVAVVTKPAASSTRADEAAFSAQLRAMADLKVVRQWRRSAPMTQGPMASDPAPLPLTFPLQGPVPCRVIAIAASTGGPAALQQVLAELPRSFPLPILVVQHISAGFTAGLAAWLGSVCAIKVKIATSGEQLAAGTAYLAPDDHHLGANVKQQIVLSKAAPVGGFRPSATVLFETIAAAYGSAVTAVILTGMGSDGQAGLRAVKAAGGRVVAQDEKTSVVFGMPQAAIDAGLADLVLPIKRIHDYLLACSSHDPSSLRAL